MATGAAERQASHTIGFESLEEEVHVDSLPVHGELPAWLHGDLTRVTPALLDVGGVPLRHWFDGLAMLNAFRIGDGRVGYASRFLQTDAYDKARKGRFEAWGFGQDPCRSLFSRMTAAFSAPDNDNANVNLARLGDRYIAMTELPLPVEFDRETLDTVGKVDWDDRVGGSVGSAHPHHDREADELISYVTEFSARNAYKLFAVPGGQLQPPADREDPRRPRAVLHPLDRHDRALPGARGLARRARPDADDPQGRGVHGQHELEARAGLDLPRGRSPQRRARGHRAGRGLLLLPPHQRVRRRR